MPGGRVQGRRVTCLCACSEDAHCDLSAVCTQHLPECLENQVIPEHGFEVGSRPKQVTVVRHTHLLEAKTK